MNDGQQSLKNQNNKNRVREVSFQEGDVCPSTSLPSYDMYRGFFPLWRKIVDWGWYKDSNTKAVYLHLLLTTNHKQSDFLGQKIEAGQCVHGILELSQNLGLTVQQVRTAIKHLKSTNEITTKATNKFTIYTLNNYQKYTPNEYTNNKRITNKQQTSNKQVTTSNNDKNDKKNISKGKRFSPPTQKEVSDYCKERKNKVNAQRFIDFYSSKGWYIGKNKMKNWQAAVRTWESEKGGKTKSTFKRPALIVASELKASQYSKQEILAEMSGKYTEREVGLALEKLF